MDFNQYVNEDLNDKYKDMLYDENITPYQKSMAIDDYSSFRNSYVQYKNRLEKEKNDFNKAIDIAKQNQITAKQKKAKIRKKLIVITVIFSIIFVVASVITASIWGIVSSIQNKKTSSVEDLIEALPNDPEYYLDYQAEIVDAYAAYQELDPKLQDKVENVDKLMSVMDGLKVAEAYEQRQNIQFTKLESGGYSVKLKEGSNSKISGELVVPGVYRQEPVVAIEDYAFENCRGITSVVVPDSIKTIGVGAFRGCNNIQSMTLPFTGKSNDATAHEAVFGYIFGYDTQRNSNASGTDYTFNNKQYGTASGTWQYTYKQGGYNYSCFYYIPTSITSVAITNQNRIPAAVFNGCMYIESIFYTKVDEISTIEEAAFQNCLALKNFNGIEENVLNISSNIMEIKYKAFYKCSKFNSVVFETGLRQIGNYAFQGCDKFTALTIPNSVTDIGVGAFNGCNKLVTVSLPFTGASATAEHENAVFGYIFGYDTQRDSNASGTDHTFKNTQYGTVAGGTWQYTYIQGGYNYSCFYYIPTTITSVTITNQTRIPATVFNGCMYIKSISYTKANDISTIGEAAFQNCLALESFNDAEKSTLNIPTSVVEIKYKAFYKCSKFNSVNFPTGLRQIGNYAFQECSEFTALIIPDTVTNIGLGAFNGCNKLVRLSLPFTGESANAEYENAVLGYIFGYDTKRDSNASGTNHAFKNTQYGSIAGGTWQYTYIQGGYNYSCFYYIPQTITSVTITNQTKVPAAAFNGCTNITQIIYSKGISLEGTCAFQNCPAEIIEENQSDELGNYE